MLNNPDKDARGDKADNSNASNGKNLISPPTISLPKGGGAIRGIGEKFAANPVTGTGSMSVPIAISPGRSGFGPQLSLSYDSGAGNGPFGLGWNLSLPSITRKTDKGLPRYQDADDSDVFVLSGAEDLVPELKKDATTGEWVKDDGNFVREEVLRDGYLVRRYRPRIEGLFARIERWTSQTEPTDVFWRSISKDNVTTFYGKTEGSRIADPSDESKIFSWLICESYDDKGNAILYAYKAEDDTDVDRAQPNERNRTRGANHYLKSIRYGNTASQVDPVFVTREAWKQSTKWLFEVIFDYGEHNGENPKPDDSGDWLCRHDPFSSYRPGFEVRTYRLCQRVLMFHHFPQEKDVGGDCLVRSTDFVYRDTRGSTTDLKQGHPIASFIASVSQSGYKRKAGGGYLKKSLPPLEFTYSEAVINEDVQEIDAESIENLPYGLDGSRYQWVDLDGEGLSGILTEQGGAWFYKRNLSALPVSTGNGTPAMKVRFAPVERLPTMPSPANLASGQQLLDLAGDGQLDVVELDGPVPGFFERTTDEGWETFRSFASLPNVAWKDPNLKFVDLTGDGHADILVTEDEVFTWYPSLAEEGFGPAEKVRQTFDEETGPRLVFADGTQSIYLSDFSGDGLTDLVRIRNGEVCYWPNLGYGRFGAKVTMDHAPWFDSPDQFDQQRIRLADIDGSGVVDIIYLAADGVRLYFNQSGNRWGDARLLSNFPPIDNLSSVQVADLLGNGTACLVWSSPLPRDARRPMRYIDLMGGQKPHLLIRTSNNLGAKTQVDYAPSTKFYLADKFAGSPWITKLPFPVHCVERVTVTDKWRDTRFASTYSYHHGYFDGIEREFRGFGRVEQVDVESFGEFQAGNAASPYITTDKTLYQPPVKTITWFHTGAALDRRRILTQFQAEYFPNSLAALPGYSALLIGFNEKPLPEPDIESQDLSADEWREALRACKGMTLRQEIYELDVDQLEAGKQIPVRLFSAATHNCHIRRLQLKGNNQHAVFLVTESEALSYNYELDLRTVTFPLDPKNILPLEPDPRVAHTLNLSFDQYGNIQQSISVGYKRAKQFADSDLTEHLDLIRAVQAEQHLAYSETYYTDDAIAPLAGASLIQQYRLRVPCEVQTYELTGIEPSPGKFYFELADLRRYVLSTRYPALPPTKLVAPKQYHERPQQGVATMRLVEHARTLFFDDNPTGPGAANRFLKEPLPLGTLGKLGLPYEQYKLALTELLLGAVFTNGQLNAVVPSDGAAPQTVLDKLNHWQTSGYLSLTNATEKFGPGAAGQYWMRSGIAGFASGAAQQFYLPDTYTDPFNNLTTLAYGKYGLFIQSSKDARDNVTKVMDFDYRVLAPAEMEDINGNHTEAWFDVLGMVVAVAVKGKVNTAGVTEADNLDGYTVGLANPTGNDLAAIFAATPDGSTARRLLGDATMRHLYHFGEKVDASGNIIGWADRPAGACAIVREQHVTTVNQLRLTDSSAKSPLQIAFECSDGFGTVLMKRSQAEPETVAGTLRWIVSGKTVLNNKGKPVKQYEPYFSTRATCSREGDPQEEVGVTSLMYYDAAGRLVRTEMPDGTFSRVELSPWHVKSFDANDTIKEPNNAWYAKHSAASASNEDKRAAKLSLVHQDTPALTILDSLGREVIAIAHNRVEDTNGPRLIDGKRYRDERYLTFTKLDAEGKPLWIRDARKNLVMQYISPIKPTRAAAEPDQQNIEAMPTGSVPCYDIAGNLLFQHSMDAGDRWMINDAAGKPMFAWDRNERQTGIVLTPEDRFYFAKYDVLHRPVEQWLSTDGGAPKMIERFEYRDTKNADGTPNAQLATDQAANLIGQLVRHYDPSGRAESVGRDFKGNVLETKRRLNNLPTESLIDWKANPVNFLETESFTQITEFDALNRMTKHYNWHRAAPDNRVAVYKPAYNERGLLLSETLTVRARKTAGSFDIVADTKTSDAIKEILYNVKGQKEFLKLGNGTITHYEYDKKTFRLQQLRTTRLVTGQADPAFPDFASNLTDARVLQQLHYTYDPVGNITEIYDEAYEPVFFQNQQVEARSRYEYDPLYRLISATGRENCALRGAPTNVEASALAAQFPVQGADPNALRKYTQTYQYDRVGNIERMHHDAGIGTWTRRWHCADDSNRLLATWDTDDEWLTVSPTKVTPYDYDTHGSMLNLARTDPRFNMRWDHRDMIGSIDLGGGGQAYYQYDASKQRIRKLLKHGIVEERIYLGGYELYRRTLGGVLKEEIETLHLFEGQQRVLMVDDVISTDNSRLTTAPLFRYQYSNHLGSACLELDHEAEIISYEEYHPYGTSAYRAMKSGIEAPPKRYRYTGMERDEESGLNYHAARHYAPWFGRWIACDPAGISISGNLYTYAANNPNVLVDQTGCAPKFPAPIVELLNEVGNLFGEHGLERSTFEGVLFEAQGGSLLAERTAIESFHLQNLQGRLQQAQNILQRLDPDVLRAGGGLGEDALAVLEETRLNVLARADLGQRVETLAGELGSDPVLSQRFAEVRLPELPRGPGSFISERLQGLTTQRVLDAGMRQLVPEAAVPAEFAGIAGEIMFVEQRAAAPVGMSMFGAYEIEQAMARATETIKAEAPKAIEYLKGKYDQAAGFVARIAPEVEKAARIAGYVLAVGGAWNATDEANKGYESVPSEAWLTQFGVLTVAGLLDMAGATAKTSWGDWYYFDVLMKSYSKKGMSPWQHDIATSMQQK